MNYGATHHKEPYGEERRLAAAIPIVARARRHHGDGFSLDSLDFGQLENLGK
jgi:hypothetical protein